MVSLNEDGKAYHQNVESHQQVFFVYDPLVCTKVKDEDASSGVRAFGCTRDSPHRCALLLGARYWVVHREKCDRVQRVDIGIGTAAPVRAVRGSGGSPDSPVEHFFSFFRRDVDQTTPAKYI
ncbi:hypothetical protein ENH_00015750 [Eimeria necatrix]|uniref:Uncharacterized protein n=1 Tax=Eimeria necatrix TaxID=51315 RepID=U6MSD6_9EIME|nr:hypothetical protein ENH_00015750 [Eimeria necatrix]CDJ66013.1 hypothetical protein ENH_00015750 [Eimeria necatrix]